MKAYRFLLAVPILAVLGCASVGVVPTKQDVSAKPSNCPLDIYASESDVKRPFETVALLTSRTGTSLFERHTIDAAIENAKKKACECGADALVVMQASSGSGWSAPYGKANATIKAIRYLPTPTEKAPTEPKP